MDIEKRLRSGPVVTMDTWIEHAVGEDGRVLPGSGALGIPGGIKDKCAGRPKAVGIPGRGDTCRVGSKKQYHVFGKYQWPPLMEHKGTRWRGVKYGSVEGQLRKVAMGSCPELIHVVDNFCILLGCAL